MMEAIQRGDVNAVRAMLDAGQDPNQRIVITPDVVMTPLRLAAVGHPEIVRLLLTRGAHPTLEEVPGLTAMDMASETMDGAFKPFAQARVEVRSILRAAGAKYRTFQETPGRHATGDGSTDRPDLVARFRDAVPHLFLIRRLLGDPQIGDAWKRAPVLVEALEAGQPKLASALLDRGADVNAVDGLGRTALHRAACQLDAGLVRDLLGRGANPNGIEKHGSTPLVWVLGPHSGPFGKPMAHVVELLLRHGADPNARIPESAGIQAKTLLGAARAKSAELADLLKSHGAKE
jgi:ankyrin repeat protein